MKQERFLLKLVHYYEFFDNKFNENFKKIKN